MSEMYQNQLELHRIAMYRINEYRRELNMLDENADIGSKEYLLRRIEDQLKILEYAEYMIRAQQNEDEAQLTRSEKNSRLIAKKND
jgi:hypothetical protein